MSQPKPEFTFRTSRGPGLMVGVMSILMGALVIGIGFGFIHTSSESVNAPRWVLVLFGGLFVLAGVWSLLLRVNRAESSGWAGFLFALLMLLGIDVLCLWIGFGSGRRLFVQDVGIGLNPATRPVDPTLGRIFFGGFGVLFSGVTLAFAWMQGRKLLRRGDKPA